VVERLNEDQERIDLKNSEQHQRLEQSTQTLHLVANIDAKRQLYAFFCESQPLLDALEPRATCTLPTVRNRKSISRAGRVLKDNYKEIAAASKRLLTKEGPPSEPIRESTPICRTEH